MDLEGLSVDDERDAKSSGDCDKENVALRTESTPSTFWQKKRQPNNIPLSTAHATSKKLRLDRKIALPTSPESVLHVHNVLDRSPTSPVTPTSPTFPTSPLSPDLFDSTAVATSPMDDSVNDAMTLPAFRLHRGIARSSTEGTEGSEGTPSAADCVEVDDDLDADQSMVVRPRRRKYGPRVIFLSDSEDDDARVPHEKYAGRMRRAASDDDVEIVSEDKERSKNWLDKILFPEAATRLASPKKSHRHHRCKGKTPAEVDAERDGANAFARLQKSPRCQIYPLRAESPDERKEQKERRTKANHSKRRESRDVVGDASPDVQVVHDDDGGSGGGRGDGGDGSKDIPVDTAVLGKHSNAYVSSVTSPFSPRHHHAHHRHQYNQRRRPRSASHDAEASRRRRFELEAIFFDSESSEDVDANKNVTTPSNGRRRRSGRSRASTSSSAVAASPDPVAQVQQLEADEMLARMLQAQFDAELDGARHPPTPHAFVDPVHPRLGMHSPGRRRHLGRLPPTNLPFQQRPRPPPHSTLSALLGRNANREDRLALALNLLSLRLGLLEVNANGHNVFNPFGYDNLSPDSPFSVFHHMILDSPHEPAPLHFLDTLPPTHESFVPMRPTRRRDATRMGPRGTRRNQMGTATNVITPVHLQGLFRENADNEYEMLWQLADQLGQVSRHRLSRRQISRLPTRVYSSSQENTGSDVCHICMSEYEEGDRLRILNCFHEFHSNCIDRWIKDNATCPVCRAKVYVAD